MKKKKKIKLANILFFCFIIYITYTFVSQQIILKRIKEDIYLNQIENSKVQEANQYLNDKIEYAKTDEFKEEIAREKIGLIKDGEIVYVIDN